MTAYDYDNQRWVTGAPAFALRQKQLTDELTALESPRGEEYARFIGFTGTVAQAIKDCRLQLSRLGNGDCASII